MLPKISLIFNVNTKILSSHQLDGVAAGLCTSGLFLPRLLATFVHLRTWLMTHGPPSDSRVFDLPSDP